MTPPQGVLQVRGERGESIPLIGVDPFNMGGQEGFAQVGPDIQNTILLELLRKGSPDAIELIDEYKPGMRVKEPINKGYVSREANISDWAEEVTRSGMVDRSSLAYHQLQVSFHRDPTYSSEPYLDRKLEAEAIRRRENPGIMHFPEEPIGDISPERRHLRYLQRQVDQERVEAKEQERIRLLAEKEAERVRVEQASILAEEDRILALAEEIQLRRAREEIAVLLPQPVRAEDDLEAVS